MVPVASVHSLNKNKNCYLLLLTCYMQLTSYCVFFYLHTTCEAQDPVMNIREFRKQLTLTAL